MVIRSEAAELAPYGGPSRPPKPNPESTQCASMPICVLGGEHRLQRHWKRECRETGRPSLCPRHPALGRQAVGVEDQGLILKLNFPPGSSLRVSQQQCPVVGRAHSLRGLQAPPGSFMTSGWSLLVVPCPSSRSVPLRGFAV